MNAVTRTDGLAEHAGSATHGAVLFNGQPMPSAPASVDGARFFGVLISRGGALFGLETQRFGDVAPHIDPEVAVGDPQAPQHFNPVDLFLDADGDIKDGDFFVHILSVCFPASRRVGFQIDHFIHIW